MQKIYLFLSFVLISYPVFSQKITGHITDENGGLLPYASVSVKNSGKGVTANDKANYSLTLEPGTYIVICQHIGYTTQEQKVIVDKDVHLDFKMGLQKLTLPEVIVNPNAEDPAYAIMRNAIKKHSYYATEVKAFSCGYYAKDMVKLRSVPNKFFGKKLKPTIKRIWG